MKSVLAGDRNIAIPVEEIESCSYLRRNLDYALGTVRELFFCMEFVGHYVGNERFHIKRSQTRAGLLLLTMSGRGRLVYRNAEYTLTRGSCMLIDIATLHEYYTVGDHWEFKFLHFSGAMSEKYIAHIEEHSVPVFTLMGDEFLQMDRTLARILDMTEEAVISYYTGISGLIYSLITLFLSHGSGKSYGDSTGSKAMSDAIAYICQNYMCSINTSDIALAANLSRSYMSEIFTRTFGIPPHEYLVQFRLSVAKDMLLNTKLTVTEIAEKTGFRDIFSFSRVFRREMDVSPTQYRQKYSMQCSIDDCSIKVRI